MRAATWHCSRLWADPRLAEFQTLKLGRRVIYLRSDLAARAAAIVTAISAIDSEIGAGNRSSGVPLRLEDGTELFARISKRGGLMRLVLKDLYVGVRARTVRELAVSTEARRRGIPVPEPIGALVEWVAPLIYRSTFLTRALRGMTLWEFLRTDDDPLVRLHVVEQARNSIDIMHRMGLFHADLNLHNLLVTKTHESFAVVVLDLDKALFLQSPLSETIRARNLARLRRSAQKVDPGGQFLDSRLLQLLTRTSGATQRG
jgi:Lipopolysaccharide kinase (Kdo/WaaP) family